MADFTIEEFEDLFLQLGQANPQLPIARYIDTVKSDYTELNRQSELEGMIVFGTGLAVPQNQRHMLLDYLILYHFARYFLDGIGFNIAIATNFTETHIPSFSLRDLNNREIGLPIDTTVDGIGTSQRDYRNLINLFGELGRTLLGADFRAQNFLLNLQLEG